MIYNSYQTAEIIGVNVSTIKRWTDMGKLKCDTTVGGHRKFNLNHISEFIKNDPQYSSKLNLGYLIGSNKSLIESIDNRNNKTLINYCYKYLIAGKINKFILLNNSLLLKGFNIHSIFDDIFLPVLEKIGNEWEKGNLTISEEHLATEIIRKFLSNLNINYLAKQTIYNAFCFTLIDDKHDLSLSMGESILNQNKKIKTFNLGASLPVEDFINLSQKTQPDIIFISIIYISDIDQLTNQMNILCKYFLKNKKTKIFLRGSGVSALNLKYNNFVNLSSFEDFQSKINRYFK